MALDQRQNALLESPTGTGKTLALICSTLSWINKDRSHTGTNLNGGRKKIYYSVRTHSQGKEVIYALTTLTIKVIKQINSTAYQPSVSILASRRHLCVNDFEDKENISVKY